VEKQAHHMMASGIASEQRPVQHVRKPGERMPKGEIGGGESPFYILKGNAILNDIIFGDVSRIVQIYKMISRDPAEGYQAGDSQKDDNDINIFFIHKLFIHPFAGI
jgi:hypothetical protein